MIVTIKFCTFLFNNDQALKTTIQIQMGSDASNAISTTPGEPGESPIIMSPSIKKLQFNTEQLVSRFADTPQISTIYELFEHTKQIAPDNDYYGMRDYDKENHQWLNSWHFVSRKDVAELRDAVGSLLISRGLPFGSHIGILSYNRTEWIIIQHACYAFGYIPVPIYDTFGWENINYIINHAELKYIFLVSTKLPDFIKFVNPIETCATNLVVFDNEEHPYSVGTYGQIEGYQQVQEALNQTNVDANAQKKFIIEKFEDFTNFSERFPHRPPKPDTPANIMYTSGTTGKPKGCILSHSNFIATAASFYTYVYPFSHDDRYVSYLPMAHVYEAVMHILALKVIGTVVFYSGSIPRLLDEIKMFRPTVFTGVTRVYERIMSGIQKKINEQSIVKRSIFKAAFHIKDFSLRYLRIKKIPIVDHVFDSIQAALGGQMKLFVCGGASMSAEQQQWMRIACRLQFIQGYGLTETTASTCAQVYSDCYSGNVGVLLPCVEAKLRDLPDHGFYAKDMSGELILRGPSIFKGYYKDPESTDKVVDKNGWFSTGDIFVMNKTGQLNIVSRCKELVKLSQGEYVALSKLTDIYSLVQDVDQIYIHAGMNARYLTAIVVLDKHAGSDVTESVILDRLNQEAAKNNLNGFEKIKAVRLIREPFTTENGMMTPSLKYCRFRIQQVYKKELDDMDRQLKELS